MLGKEQASGTENSFLRDIQHPAYLRDHVYIIQGVS